MPAQPWNKSSGGAVEISLIQKEVYDNSFMHCMLPLDI
jgi:hypothetical protein